MPREGRQDRQQHGKPETASRDTVNFLTNLPGPWVLSLKGRMGPRKRNREMSPKEQSVWLVFILGFSECAQV
jgi:hypothetical protein